MSIKLIGFEGGGATNVDVAWGAAAFIHDKRLFNAVTKLSVGEDELDDYVVSGAITLLPRALIMDDVYKDTSCYVARLNIDSKLYTYLNIHKNVLTGVIDTHTYKDSKIYLFSDLKDLNLYAKRAIDALVSSALSATSLPDNINSILSAGYILDSTNPYINALKVYATDSNNRLLAKELALLNLRNEKEKEKFNVFLEALENEVDDYMLHYQGGVTTGGGMDIVYIQKVLSSLSVLHSKTSGYLEEMFRPIRSYFKSPRLGELASGSAKLHFKTKIEEESIAERVARYLELDLISKVIGGEKIPEIVKDPKVSRAVREIVELDESTNLQHKLMGSDDEIDVPIESIEQGDEIVIESQSFTVLGFQSGLINDASDIEIHIDSKNIKLSATDDGYDKEPRGVEYLKDSSGFLFKPLIFSIYLRYLDDKKHKYFLASVKEPEINKSYIINAIPSSVFKDSFWVGADIEFVLGKGSFSINGDEIDISGISFESAEGWLRDYMRWCLRCELDGIDEFELLRPTREKLMADSLQRLIYSVGSLGNEAEQQNVVKYINENLGADGKALVNNTRRVIKGPNLEYIVRTGEKNRTFQLTEDGVKYYKVIKSAVDFGVVIFTN